VIRDPCAVIRNPMHPDRERWNAKYRSGVHHETPNVSLIMHRDRLARGRALDVAGGTGDNAALLALAGWRVAMCDVSDEAVTRARARAGELKAAVDVVQADAMHLPFRGPFDLVVCTFYTERALAPVLVSLLRPGGTLFVETFSTATLKYTPDFRREFCVAPGELRRLFALDEVLYREDDDGRQATALYIGRKP
jgi:SAM-dependent methyltransferase